MKTDENGNIISLDLFDSEPGFYQQVIRPMLAPGHETELLYWLKEVGLIPQTQFCKNAKLDDCCNKPMSWTPAKVQDSYQWKCLNCSQRRTVRDNSVFCEVRCNFKNAIRTLLGWCKGLDVETMTNSLGVRKAVVNVVYNIAAKTADGYIRNHLGEWRLGGPGVVVLIDTYPEGCANQHRPVRNCKPILCCAEAKGVPPKYWLQALERMNRNNIAAVKATALEVIQNIVAPGSILVVDTASRICSYDDLQGLGHLYPVIVTIGGLARHNNENQNITSNLETIWKLALDICEEAQYFDSHQLQNFLISRLWRQRFGNECFEQILHQLIQ